MFKNSLQHLEKKKLVTFRAFRLYEQIQMTEIIISTINQ